MIGVLAKHSEHTAIREFFELFKTPWEFCRKNKQYDVVLCTTDDVPSTCGTYLTIIFAGRELLLDRATETGIAQVDSGVVLSYGDVSFPIYGKCVLFPNAKADVVADVSSGQSLLCYQTLPNGKLLTRFGYDLFHEIGFLLTQGQPTCYASTPTLDLHIQFLRNLIIQSGAFLAEIPPFPEGFRFMACLTHDVDHPFLKRHRFDHTMLGFLYRASVGSVLDYLRGRKSGRDLLANWQATIKLPFVILGLADDLWAKFDSYVTLENGNPSSFFIIPFKGNPGRKGSDPAPKFRAATYGVADLSAQIEYLQSAGCEIGLHGLDAWRDTESARAELDETRKVVGKQASGVRIHWLYYDEHSAEALENAGAGYDSTVGYNETIGYKAGTGQSYKPLNASRLLELPMHVMDTAIFYPNYLNLSATEAKKKVRHLIEHAIRTGGVLTVNWHDRSIAPERLWGDFYKDLVADLERSRAWFGTAGDVVSWFQKRRSVVLDNDLTALDKVAECNEDRTLPGLCLQIHNQNSRLLPETPGKFNYAV